MSTGFQHGLLLCLLEGTCLTLLGTPAWHPCVPDLIHSSNCPVPLPWP